MTSIKCINIFFICMLGLSSLGCYKKSVVSAKDYEVRFIHPNKIGEKCRMSSIVTSEQLTKISMHGKVAQSDSSIYTLEFEANIETLEINNQQNTTKLSMNTLKFDKIHNEKRSHLLPPKTVVIASVKDGKEFFKIDGLRATGELHEALSLISPLETRGLADKDLEGIFGTKERKSIGDEWPINSTLAASVFEMQGLEINVEDITGTMKLEEIVQRDQYDYLQFRGTMLIERAIPSYLPQGIDEVQASITAEFSDLSPVAQNFGGGEASIKMSMSVVTKEQSIPDALERTVEVNRKVSVLLTDTTDYP